MKMRREKETSVADESNRAFDPHFRQEEAGEDSPGEMGFFEHLEELRWRIIKALLSLVVTSALCGIFYDELWQILLYPATRHGITLQNLNVFGQITLTIQVCLLSGFILGIPEDDLGDSRLLGDARDSGGTADARDCRKGSCLR